MKAQLQRVLSVMPGGYRANLLLQTHFFHGLPISDARLEQKLANARGHIARLQRIGQTPIAEAQFFEFGAGWDLAIPLALYCVGVSRQSLVDIRPLAQRLLVADIVNRLRRRNDLPRLPPPYFDPLAAYLQGLGIDYRAPADASTTGLPDASVDYITSTNTLEHIPAGELVGILRECHRIVSPEGAISVRVDYQDHYAYFDARRTVYDFLTYDVGRWRRWSPALHYQNRLRHHDYLALYASAGLHVLEDDPWGGDASDLDVLSELRLAEPFCTMPREAVAIRGAWTVLSPTTVLRRSLIPVRPRG